MDFDSEYKTASSENSVLNFCSTTYHKVDFAYTNESVLKYLSFSNTPPTIEFEKTSSDEEELKPDVKQFTRKRLTREIENISKFRI